MSEISRREFVKTTAGAVAAGVVLTTGLDVHANPLGFPIGCQTWPVRDMIGKKAAQAGIQQGLHNEDFELSNVDGQRTYDLLLGLLDPKLVKFQFQVSTIAEGYDAAQYFMKYPGRFISMHVQGWDSKTRKIVAVGQGTVDWMSIFTAAKTGGVKNYFVEMDLERMRASVPYLRKLQV